MDLPSWKGWLMLRTACTLCHARMHALPLKASKWNHWIYVFSAFCIFKGPELIFYLERSCGSENYSDTIVSGLPSWQRRWRKKSWMSQMKPMTVQRKTWSGTFFNMPMAQSDLFRKIKIARCQTVTPPPTSNIKDVSRAPQVTETQNIGKWLCEEYHDHDKFEKVIEHVVFERKSQFPNRLDQCVSLIPTSDVSEMYVSLTQLSYSEDAKSGCLLANNLWWNHNNLFEILQTKESLGVVCCNRFCQLSLSSHGQLEVPLQEPAVQWAGSLQGTFAIEIQPQRNWWV